MTDDELIVLWSLAGMDGWIKNDFEYEFPQIMNGRLRGVAVTLLEPYQITLDLFGIFIQPNRNYLYEYGNKYKTLYIIDDLLTFNPDERWWKLLFARRWYEKNKEQFNDG